MLFSSLRFVVFLAALLGLLALPLQNRAKLRVLAVASCFFYAAWDYRYLALLFVVSVVDYLCARAMKTQPSPRGRRFYLVLSIASNLGILGYFKYANFFVENVNLALGSLGVSLPFLDVLLPAGVSFYTFKTMSYTIDVYRGHLEPVDSLLDYITFVTFFPELIAGPIVRASVFLPQMTRPIGPTSARLALGASVFLLGLTKKLLLADRLAIVADPIFADPALYSGGTLWLGALAYSLQIYCDFSGYSDMAVGVAKMIGYDLPENFAMPYLSASPTEFWRRWHITLSTWLRDYVYIPLGGNRGGPLRTYVNLMVTMLLGGLWHGASWNFVLWGGLHGVALAIHRFASGTNGGQALLPRALSVPLTFLFVTLCWIPFRAPSFAATARFASRMFTFAPGATWISTNLIFPAAVIVVGHAVGIALERAARRPDASTTAVLAWLGARLEIDEVRGWSVRLGLHTLPGAYLVFTWLLVVYGFAATAVNPFIYFQF